MSRSFGDEGPVRPHLTYAGRGKEISDLRADAEKGFISLEKEIDGVATTTALSALADAAFPDGKPMFVASPPGHVRLDRSSSATPGDGVYVTASGQGRWLRVSGGDGADGENAFSIVTMGSTWEWENGGGEIALDLNHIGWLSVGQVVHISDGVHNGRLVVEALGEFAPEFPNIVTFINSYPADGPAGGTVMLDGAKVSPAGTPGSVGEAGPAGPAGATGATGGAGPVGPMGPSGVFGDGSDGAYTAPVGTTTLSAPMQYTTLVVPSGATLIFEWIQCSVSCDVQVGGVLSRKGNDAVGSTPGAAIADNIMGGGSAGGAGATGGFSNAGGAFLADAGGGQGGTGGTAGSAVGGSGGAKGAFDSRATGWRSLVGVPGRYWTGATAHLIAGGTGGGSGRGNGSGTSGGGGGGAPTAFLAAKTLTVSGTITVAGGAGGNATGAGGPGGGGGGGVLWYVAESSTITGTITAAGGAAGTGGSGEGGQTTGAAGKIIPLT